MSTHALTIPTPREPHLSRFRELIRRGAGTLDKHDEQDTTSPFIKPATAYDALIEREVDRVRVHLHSLCRLLEAHVGPTDEILDVGCGTGATTVAMALAPGLKARRVIGLDPNGFSLEAARARWSAYEATGGQAEFQQIAPDKPLPFDDQRFPLTVCVSVIEYLGDTAMRQGLVDELLRVTRPGGHVCLITPNPLRLRDYHTHRVLGDWRRTPGYPWASAPWELAAMFRGHDVRFLLKEQLAHGLAKRTVPGAALLARCAPLGWLLPWQKLLVRKR